MSLSRSICRRLLGPSSSSQQLTKRWNSSLPETTTSSAEEYASMDGVTASNDSSSSTTTISRTTDGYAWSNMYDEAHEMMMASYMLYPITYVMRESRAGRLKHSDRVRDKLKACTDGDMTTELHPHDFLEIFQDNYDYIAANYPSGDKERFGWLNVMKLYHKRAHEEYHEDDSIGLMEFDDKQESSRLVYGIGINKTLKRITVIFRGTYADETRDWARNVQCSLVDVPLPEAVQEAAASSLGKPTISTQLCVHRGIYEYLLRNSERGPDYPQERYEEIVGHILACLKDHPDYKVFVCGHSLGGALGLLLAFFASADDRIPKPVTCVSLGSLLVGDATFQRAFEQLESLGWIRHLRITNQHDPVPCLPPLSWYKPVGMHLELKADARHGHSLLHHNSYTDSTLQTINNTLSGLWQTYRATGASVASMDKWIDPHLIPEYLERLERERPVLEQIYLNDCYRDPEYVGKHFTTKL